MNTNREIETLPGPTKEVRVDAPVSTQAGVAVDGRAAKTGADRVTVNDIGVQGTEGAKRPDTEISKAVRVALAGDASVPGTRMQSAVSSGWVMLEGTVSLLREREAAERAVRRIVGIKGVYNLIKVEPPKVIREAVKEALERQAEREAARMQVHLNDGMASLSGRVHSWEEKQQSFAHQSAASPVFRESMTFCGSIPTAS